MKMIKKTIRSVLAAVFVLVVACTTSYANSAIVVKNKPLEPSQVGEKHLDVLSGMKHSLAERLKAYEQYVQATSGQQERLAKCTSGVCQMAELKKGAEANTLYGKAMHKHAQEVRALEEKTDFIAKSMEQKADEYYENFDRKRSELINGYEQVAPLIQSVVDNPDIKNAEDLSSLSSDQRFQLEKYAIEFNKSVFDLDIMMKEIVTIDNTAKVFAKSTDSIHGYGNDSEIYGDKLLAAAFQQQRQIDFVRMHDWARLADDDFNEMYTSINDAPQGIAMLDVKVSAWVPKSDQEGYKSPKGSGLGYIFDAGSIVERIKKFKRD